MFKAIILFFVAVATCQADNPGTSQASSPVICGYIPKNIFRCIGSPTLLNHLGSTKCYTHEGNECNHMTCIFKEVGWMKGTTIDKSKMLDHLTQFGSEHQAWLPAVNHIKATCLGDAAVPAQGYYLECPAFDVMHCVLTGLLKKASPSQWKSTPECQQHQRYAASCPICPDSCFATQVPIGSCNACTSLPRSP